MALSRDPLEVMSARQFLLNLNITYFYSDVHTGMAPAIKFLLELLGATVTDQILPTTRMVLCDDHTLHSPRMALLLRTIPGNIPVVSHHWIYGILYYNGPCAFQTFRIDVTNWAERASEHGMRSLS